MPDGIFRPNDSLLATLRDAMAAEGCGIFERLSVAIRVRRMNSRQRAELELRLTQQLQSDVEAGLVSLPASAAITGGVLVSTWQDLFAWFVANLPAILEMIATIMALFAAASVNPLLLVFVLGTLLLLSSTAVASQPAACPGGVCRAAVRVTAASANHAVRPLVQQGHAVAPSSTLPRRVVLRGRVFHFFRLR